MSKKGRALAALLEPFDSSVSTAREDNAALPRRDG
jgi:hypothetical protein